MVGVRAMGGSSADGSWIEDIEQSMDELVDSSRSAEKDFLSLGKKLLCFSKEAREISALSSTIAGQLSGEGISHAIDRLYQMSGRINRLEDRAGRGTDVLENILLEINNLNDPLASFGKIIKTLKMVCVLMKIENARIDCNNAGFEAVAEDVSKLGFEIRQKIEHMAGRSGLLTCEIDENLSRARKTQVTQQCRAQFILDRIVVSIKALTEKHKESSLSLNKIANQYEKISGNIGAIVASMQFHDITRQRIDHVRAAVRDITDNYVSASGKGESACSADEAANICRLQTAHLDHTCEELTDAVGRITDSLVDISPLVRQMVQETGSVIGNTGLSEDSFLTDLRDDIALLKAAVSDYNYLHDEMSGTMKAVAGTADEMQAFVDEIERIGMTMKIVAINARINAYRIGNRGQSLISLSQHVGELSVETTCKIKDISDRLRLIITSTRSLFPHIHEKNEEESYQKENLPAELDELAEEFRLMNEKIVNQLKQIDQAGAALSEGIQSAAFSFCAHRELISRINTTISALRAAENSLQGQVQSNEADRVPDDINRLKRRYTMDREREIHAKIIQKSSQGASRVSVSRKSDQPPGAGTGEFGDNVELF